MKYLHNYKKIVEHRMVRYSFYQNFTREAADIIYLFLNGLYYFDKMHKASRAFVSSIPYRLESKLNFGDGLTTIEVLETKLTDDIVLKVTICKNIEDNYIIRLHFTELRPILVPPMICFTILADEFIDIDKFKEEMPSGTWEKEDIEPELLVKKLKNMRKR
jgi:hypothetical protein